MIDTNRRTESVPNSIYEDMIVFWLFAAKVGGPCWPYGRMQVFGSFSKASVYSDTAVYSL